MQDTDSVSKNIAINPLTRLVNRLVLGQLSLESDLHGHQLKKVVKGQAYRLLFLPILGAHVE